jgi:hypothetical protein
VKNEPVEEFCKNDSAPLVRECPDCIDKFIFLAQKHEFLAKWNEAENVKLRAEHKSFYDATVKAGLETFKKLDESTLQKDELREALRELVQEVEDSWHHHGRCLIGTDEQKPETECECGPDLEVPLAILGRIRPSKEKKIDEICWCASKAEAPDAVCPIHG